MSTAQLKILESPVGAELVIDGRRIVNFAGSSYLGMSDNPEMLAAGEAALRLYGAGYQIARNYQIATASHLEVEKEAGLLFDSEAALYLPSGYYFGLVTMAVLRDQFESFFFDEQAHHCMRAGMAASGRPCHPFKHLDPEDLATQLKRHLGARERPLVITDGMYSTFGEIAPLHELARIAAPYGGRLLVDESHSFGILGTHGRGAAEHHGLGSAEVLTGGSLSKAFGAAGGVIPASDAEVAALRRTPASRSSSVGIPATAAISAASLRYVRQHPELQRQLRANTTYAKRSLRGLGLDVGDSIAPVATFVVDQNMRVLQERLMEKGIFVLHSNYIGASSTGAIRCGIFADHTHAHIDALTDALRRLL